MFSFLPHQTNIKQEDILLESRLVYNQTIKYLLQAIGMSDPNKKSQTLKIDEEKEMLTIQINELALQVIFNSPILDVCNYHEQLQKYNYRAALSSINLKVDEFDEYYSAVRERVDTFYNTLMYRSVAMIQDLLLSVRFAKIEMWREQTMIINGLRSNLYCKDIDPYNFNVQQFNSDIKTVNDIAKTNTINCKQAQEMIAKFLSRLKEVQSAKMEEMFIGRVHNPYLATNKDGVQVDPSSMYESYLSYLSTKMERSDESIFRKHFVIHDEIIKFGQAIFDHSLKYQKYASFAVKKYNDALPNDHQTTNIAPIIKMEVKRVHFDVDELLPGRQNRLDSKPALINKVIKVQFKQTNRVLDLQTMNEQTVEHIKNEERKHYQRKLHEETVAIKQSPFETFAEQRRIVYKDYYQHRDFQKKMREEEIRYGSKDYKEREKQRIVIRRIIRTINVPAPWLELTEYQCPFIYFLNNRNEKQDLVWDIKNKTVDKNPSPLNFFSKREKEQKLKVNEIENKAQLEHKQKIERQQAFAFEDKRFAQQKLRISKSKHKMMNRTYQAFMKMNKMELAPAIANSQEVSRFGITLRTTLSMNDVVDMDKFFYYYYKQRYYRQNEQVKEMSDNPIIYLDSKKVNMSAIPKVVGSFLSSIVKRIKTMNFFLLWTDDLICFRLRETKQKKIAEFECYNYTQSNNTQKLMYQIRRRISLQIKEIHHYYAQLEALDIVMSKVEVGHRMIFNRHRIMPAAVISAMKGRQLAEQIFQQLKQRYSNG